MLRLNIGDEIEITEEQFRDLLIKFRDKKGHGFKKELRDGKAVNYTTLLHFVV